MDNQPSTQEDDPLLTPAEISKLHWRCRRGLLENDLFIEKFFKSFEQQLRKSNLRGLELLMDLSDNDLLDIFLRKSEPSKDLNVPEVHEIIAMIRQPTNLLINR